MFLFPLCVNTLRNLNWQLSKKEIKIMIAEQIENKSVLTTKKVQWKCPSNIALVKYWGKLEGQIPCNPSISMTLSEAYTTVDMELENKETESNIELDYYFEGKLNKEFGARVEKFIQKHQADFPFADNHKIIIRSENTFPHSAGIASSASAFGAIALALMDFKYAFEHKQIDEEFYKLASNFARLGSGSASRSVYPSYAIWGESSEVEKSSDLFAIPTTNIHPIFQNFHDTILIVENEPKKVSSSVGHSLMNNHPFSEQRFEQAKNRVVQMKEVLENGDMETFIQITESEALTLHAMMMTSNDYYLLMKPNTISIIEKVFEFREKSGIPVCFTLDAGPNIHLLYPNEHASSVQNFIDNELKPLCLDCLYDKIGNGPQKLQ